MITLLSRLLEGLVGLLVLLALRVHRLLLNQSGWPSALRLSWRRDRKLMRGHLRLAREAGSLLLVLMIAVESSAAVTLPVTSAATSTTSATASITPGAASVATSTATATIHASVTGIAATCRRATHALRLSHIGRTLEGCVTVIVVILVVFEHRGDISLGTVVRRIGAWRSARVHWATTTMAATTTAATTTIAALTVGLMSAVVGLPATATDESVTAESSTSGPLALLVLALVLRLDLVIREVNVVSMGFFIVDV